VVGRRPVRALWVSAGSVPKAALASYQASWEMPNSTTHNPEVAGREAVTVDDYWRAMCIRSSASSSWISSPLTSTVTLWIVPVNLKGLA
jgi:hypothetical protein